MSVGSLSVHLLTSSTESVKSPREWARLAALRVSSHEREPQSGIRRWLTHSQVSVAFAGYHQKKPSDHTEGFLFPTTSTL
jgi:hypothetical protein